MGSKDAPQQMHFLGAIKKWQVWICGAKMQNGGKSPQIRPSPAQNGSEAKFCLDIPTVREQGQICVRGFMGKINKVW